MPYPYDQVFAADPATPENVASNGVVTIFAPGDPARTPLTITTLDGLPLSNPMQVNDAGFGPAFMHATLDQVAWAGGGYSGLFVSYKGMKDEAVAARRAAEAAVTEVQSPTDQSVDRGILRADIPGKVAEAVAADDMVANAAAAAAAPAVMELLDTSPRIPSIESEPGVIGVLVDAFRRHTWMGARSKDGGPTDHSLKLLLARIDETMRLPLLPSAPGLIGALLDRNGLQTWIAARSLDGGPTDHAMKLLTERLAEVGFTPGETTEPLFLDGAFGSTGADVAIPLPNMGSTSGWGSSSLNLWAPKFEALFTGYGSAYYNGAAPGEQVEHICARLGSHPAKLIFPADTIPASGAVTVTASNMPASASMKSFTGKVAGISGTLSSTASVLAFTRTGAGSDVKVGSGAEFIPTIGPLHRNDVVVWGAGKNNLNGVAGRDMVVNKMTDEAIAWLAPRVKRVLMLGEFVNRGASAAAKAQVLAVNAHRAARYGNIFVDTQDYITSPQVWVDTGIAPTANDLAQQANGEKPDSLSIDDPHLNAAGQAATFARFAARLDRTNWY